MAIAKGADDMRCDLHTHSNRSDGSYTPQELVREAAALGLTVALTDHNTTAGLGEFLDEAERLGVEAVAGVELSGNYDGREFHLLGLFLPRESFERIESAALYYREKKEESNEEMVQRLRAAGYDISYEELLDADPDTKCINRAHVAAMLIKKGYAQTIDECFDSILSKDGGFYCEPDRMDLCYAIRLVKESGGVAVLAHPLKDTDEESLCSMLDVLIPAGLDAIETMHSSYDDKKRAISERICAERGLLRSGGSDFHGDKKPLIALGTGKGNVDVPYDVCLSLKARSAGKSK